uniref:Cysteine-rich RLK (Receptor-like protein kinase) 8 n=1 Tax=Tanacetum cinerariifolium TaxID=118510 RepID=A0A699IEF6_TANCI|nr:cysteine-rich RLK (receptor-like protein kinase) 8 [Tanacetum cinerariifolium]
MVGNSQNNTPPPVTEEITSNNPLFLHQTDHPGLILISKKLTGLDNYSSWKRSIMIALNAKNKMKLVTGAFPEPSVDNNLNFINSVSKLWDELQENYAQIDGHIIFQLTNEMVQLKQENCSVEVYYHKLKGFWDEYDALEAPYMCICACNYNNERINDERDQRKRKEGHYQEECYKIDGYLVGHPLNGKYHPTKATRPTQDNMPSRTINMTVGHDKSRPQVPVVPQNPIPNNKGRVSGRMDQLRNQINQVLLMIQNNQGTIGQGPEQEDCTWHPL